MIKRVFLIVLDSLGAGAEPDAAEYGDAGAHTLRSVSTGKGFCINKNRQIDSIDLPIF